MTKYDNSEMDFHKFFKGTRKEKKVAMRQVALGLCSVSALSRTEAGERVQEKLMRDRLLARIGVSAERFEEYLRVEEYAQWKQRMIVLQHIKDGDVEGAERELQQLKVISEKNVVFDQYVDAMNYMILQKKGASKSLLSTQAYLAIARTVPSFEMAFRGANLLADQELNLILELFYNMECKEENEYAWRMEKYQWILDYMEKSGMDDIARAKLYPRLACYVAELTIGLSKRECDWQLAYDLCEKAQHYLQKTNRLYRYAELLERSILIGNRMLGMEENPSKQKELSRKKEENTKELLRIRADYEKVGLNPYATDFTYLYEESDCQNAIDVIDERMTMMHYSRQRMEKSVCSSRTILRMVRHKESITLSVIRAMFDRLGIYPDYKNRKVLTTDIGSLQLYEKLECLIKDQNWELAASCLDELKRILDMEIVQNEQTIGYMDIFVQNASGMLKPCELEEALVDKLECTLSVDCLNAPRRYFTNMEWYGITALAFLTKGEIGKKCLALIEKYCEAFLKNEISSNALHKDAYIFKKMSTYYKEERQFEKSRSLEKMYQISCLKNRIRI